MSLAEDFTRAGEASSDLKNILKQMGVSPDTVRKVSIAMYEGEINMVIHANGGVITVYRHAKRGYDDPEGFRSRVFPTLTKRCRPAILQPLTTSDLSALVPVWDYLI